MRVCENCVYIVHASNDEFFEGGRWIEGIISVEIPKKSVELEATRKLFVPVHEIAHCLIGPAHEVGPSPHVISRFDDILDNWLRDSCASEHFHEPFVRTE